MYSAASGMEAFLFQLDTVANNMANAGTTGFKRSRANFEDLFYEHYKPPGILDNQGNQTAVGISVGLGTRVESTQLDFEEGSLVQTGKPLDIAIAGEGFFEVTDNINTYYTRAGNFSLNANGQIVMASADRGLYLNPGFTVPNDAIEIAISNDGVISVLQAGQTTYTQLGTIQLAKYPNPEGLLQLGNNLYQQTPASNSPIISNPGFDGVGTLRQGFLEQSNVEPVVELVDLIKTQRNVELNSQILQASDQLLQLLTNLRRF